MRLSMFAVFFIHHEKDTLEIVLYERQINEAGHYLVFLSCTVVKSVFFFLFFFFSVTFSIIVFIAVTGIN